MLFRCRIISSIFKTLSNSAKKNGAPKYGIIFGVHLSNIVIVIFDCSLLLLIKLLLLIQIASILVSVLCFNVLFNVIALSTIAIVALS